MTALHHTNSTQRQQTSESAMLSPLAHWHTNQPAVIPSTNAESLKISLTVVWQKSVHTANVDGV